MEKENKQANNNNVKIEYNSSKKHNIIVEKMIKKSSDTRKDDNK